MQWNFLVYSAGCASTDLLAYARHSLMPDYVFPVRHLGKAVLCGCLLKQLHKRF